MRTTRLVCGWMVVIAALLSSPLGAQDTLTSRADGGDTTRSRLSRELYPGYDYGTDGYFSPVSAFLNKGFDHFQAKNTSRDFWRFPFRNALENGALDALRHPVERIQEYPGWSVWLRDEVFPLSLKPGDARWVVNYAEHLVAGGLTYRRLGEWYDVRGFPLPRLWAAATTFGAGIMNEAAENYMVPHASSSSVADLYVFDLGGILVMNWDPLTRLLVEKMQASDWSNLATFTFPNGDLQNSGQYYIVKLPLPGTSSRLFLRSGMGIQGGISRKVDAEHALTVALGLDTETRTVNPVTLDESIHMELGGGVYYDRNNSLLASITAGPTSNRIIANVYPGVLGGFGRDLGVWAAYTRNNKLTFGIVHRRLLGLGLGYGS